MLVIFVFGRKYIFLKILMLFLLGFLFRCFFNLTVLDYLVEVLGFVLILDFQYDNSTNKLFLNDSNLKSSNILRESVKLSSKDLGILDRCRRRLYWIFIEERKDHFVNYDDFKHNWNPDIDLSKEFKHKLFIQKETLKWILRRRHP